MSRDACLASLAVAAVCSLLPEARADYQSEILGENPLAYYRFSDGVSTVDPPPSPAINSGSLGAAANGAYQLTFTRGVAGAISGNTAVAFVDNATPGSIDHTGSITVPNNAALNPSHTGTNPFTVECWVLPSRDTSTLLSPVNSMSFTTGRAGYLIYQNSATWQLRMGNKASTTATLVNGGTVTVGQWQHLAATYSGGTSGTMTLYVNGVSVASAPVANYEANDNAPFVIGATSAPNRTFDGAVDEVAFIPAELSAARILARFNERTNNPAGYSAHVLADSPAGYWRLDEAPYILRTPPVADNLGTLGSGADGAYSSQAQNASTGPSPASGFGGFGANNSCLTLPNANGFVTSNQPLLNGRTAFTVMGWMKRGATHTTRGGYFGQNDLLEFGDAGNDTNVEAWINATGGNIVQPHNMVDDQWTFICLTGDGNTNRLFVNGAQVGERNQTVADYGSSAFNFNIGGGGIFNTTGDFFRGEVDEVAIFGHAVTPGRVQQLYDAALSNTGPGLVNAFPSVSPSGSIPEGKPYTLSIDATGSPPFTYQWKLNGADIPGATSTTYTVSSAVANTPPGTPYSYSVVVTNGSGTVSSEVTDVLVAPTLIWIGTDPGNPGDWDVGISQNWKTFTGGTAATYADENAVIFDDTATLKTVELTQDVTPVAVTFDNDTNYSITGADWVIAGGESSILSKGGSGVLEIANFGVVVEKVEVSEGTLRVGNGTSGALSAIADVSMLGGQLQINQGSGTIYDSPTVMSAGTSLSVTGSGGLEIVGAITGSPITEVFSRSGTVVVATANTAGKTVTINSGTVAFDGSQQSNRTAANAAITVNSGATMEARGVNALPGGPVNSVDVVVNSATLDVVSGESAATGAGGQSHTHLRDITLNEGQIILSYSGGGSAYNGESFQLNGDLTVTGSGASTISNGTGADIGNSGIALLAVDPLPAPAPAVHTFSVPDVSPGVDLTIATELETSDAAAADSAASSIVKTGTGTLRLAGNINHSYTGTLQVSQGTLEASGSIAGPLTLASGTSIRPGTSVGTFGAGATTLGGTFHCEIDGAVADKIVVTGNLTIQPGAQISFNVLGGGVTASSYELISCSGAVTGSLPAVSGVPAGYSVAFVSNSVVLVQSGFNPQPMISSTAPPLNGIVDFNSNGGGFSASAPVTPETDWTYSAGSWRSAGQATGFGTDNTTHLLSPVYTLTQAGPVTLSFTHRYSFEADFDAGAVQVSVNGGAFTHVPGTAFSQNPYDTTAPGDVTHSLANKEAFMGNSTGHPAFITSICTVATGVAGNTVQVRFTAAYDNNTAGDLTPPGWEIDSLQVTGGVPSLMTLTWPLGIMQYSDNLQPPWTDIPGTSPLVIDAKAAPKRFFRLKP